MSKSTRVLGAAGISLNGVRDFVPIICELWNREGGGEGVWTLMRRLGLKRVESIALRYGEGGCRNVDYSEGVQLITKSGPRPLLHIQFSRVKS